MITTLGIAVTASSPSMLWITISFCQTVFNLCLWLTASSRREPAATGMMSKYSIPQLLSLNNYTTPTCISAIKQFGILRRPRYIHRGSRRKFVYNQPCPPVSSIPSIWTTVACLPRHHSADALGLPLLLPHTKPKRQIRFRNLKNINPDTMTSDLQHLSTITPTSSPGSPRPCQNQNSHFLTLSPLVHLRAEENEDSGACPRAALQGFRPLCSQTGIPGPPKCLRKVPQRHTPWQLQATFSTINHLLKPQTPLHKDTTEEQCDHFITFFRKKVETIRSLLSNSAALPVLTTKKKFANVENRVTEEVLHKANTRSDILTEDVTSSFQGGGTDKSLRVETIYVVDIVSTCRQRQHKNMASVVYCIVLLCLTSGLWMEAEVNCDESCPLVGLSMALAVSSGRIFERTGLMLRRLHCHRRESGFYPIDHEYNQIRQLVRKATGRNRNVWVGGHDAVQEGVWLWSDGSKFSFGSWYNGEPNNHGKKEHCMEINYGSQDVTSVRMSGLDDITVLKIYRHF
ncbi:hypothetical protein F7725_001073 [Dissostichus mawsoni]|uniref:C-type lectin domain-containing protein n=1 Tax=Dissostichus mawsoni TaxID=36200 RepID=A0A7J5ZKD3_DISMA|nr:hypothetical protein F7725_001073 [Dissostichus mawsoni]